MNKRGLKILISYSLCSLKNSNNSIFPSKSSPVMLSHSLKISHQNLSSIFTRFISTSPPDNLDGLIDPDDPENSPAEPVSNEDFAFLRDSSVQELDAGKCSNDAASIVKEILSDDDWFGNKTQKLLRQYRDRLSESLVIDVLNLIKNPELGVKFFIWTGRQIGYTHTGAVYNALLEMIEKCASSDKVPEHFLLEIKDDDKEVLGKLLNVLIQKCCRKGLWNLALEELGRLKDFGYKPSRSVYNALVQVFLKAERLDTAYLVHREMSDLGFNMDEYTLGCFAQSLCKAGKWREALSLTEEEDFVPDTVFYTKMISGLCEASLFEEAMDILNRMRASSCIPNVVTYRVLLCGCLRKRQLGRCKRILNMMIMEGCYPSPKIFNSLVHAYCRSGDYSYAYKLLKKMVKCGCQPGYVFNVSNFAKCLCEAGKFEKAHNIIYQMISKGFVPDTSTYSKVIGYLCNILKVEKAFSLFEEMKRNGVVPDVYTYTILIDGFCKTGLIEQARNLFDEMVKAGCAPNIVTYTALMHAYLKARKVSNANELYEKMLSEGCIPNIVTYTALIDGHCKAGQVEKACQIYARMRDKLKIPDVDMYFRVVVDDAIDPNTFTYGALVDGLCKAHKVKEAHDLLDAMSAEGCEPNHIVDALIDGFCKAGKLDEAQEVFAKMSEGGYSANVYTYSSLIDRLFKDKRLDLAIKVLSKMLENSCAPNVVIYTEMIDGLCKVGKTDEAYKLMLMMEEKGCYPNVVTYTAMIDGFGKSGKLDKCHDLLRIMASKGCAPNFVTYRVLINHCCAAGLLDDAHELLEEMKQTYWPRHMAGYRKVIEGFKKEFIASLGLLEEMGDNDSVPVIPVYKVLIDNFIKAGRLEVALELYNEIASCSPFSATDKDLCNSLIEILSLASKMDKAFELCMDMISRGAVPELSTFAYLIKRLIKVDKWEEALQLSDSMCQM
ncbi:LOW QUALITY PROTEIN: PPR domain-containing protein/PPR_1 domain-containing protein/PPR_2 domain-containing protein, partial [Cephalotus follicularis]